MKGLFFLGVDPQQSSAQRADDGAVTIGVAVDQREKQDRELAPREADFRFGYVYHRFIKGFTSVQWAGFIHGLHQGFGFTNIGLDAGAGGGGINVMRHLADRNQTIPTDIFFDGKARVDVVRNSVAREVRPITPWDVPEPVDRQPILSLMKRGDVGIEQVFNERHAKWVGDDNFVDALQQEMNLALQTGRIGLLPTMAELDPHVYKDWTAERLQILALSDQLRKQLMGIAVKTVRDPSTGQDRELRTAHGARIYQFPARKDLAYSAIYSYMAFRIWLRFVEQGYVPESEDQVWSVTF